MSSAAKDRKAKLDKQRLAVDKIFIEDPKTTEAALMADIVSYLSRMVWPRQEGHVKSSGGWGGKWKQKSGNKSIAGL